VRARPTVSGDPIRLQQVLQNLLANAVKYSPDTGTIRVVVEERAGADPCPGAHHSGGAPPPGAPGARWAVVTVEDNGFGIPAPDVPHVFERYRRASGAASRVRGTGLGLYSSRAIAEAHGGRLCIERTASVEEAGGQGWHGTVMALALPLTEQPPGGDEASADEGGGAGAARHEAPGRKRAEVAQ